MDGLDDIQRKNEKASAQELVQLRADTIKGLAFAFEQCGTDGVLDLLKESATLVPVFDRFADNTRPKQEEG